MALNEIYLEIFGFYGSPVKKVPDPCSRLYIQMFKGQQHTALIDKNLVIGSFSFPLTLYMSCWFSCSPSEPIISWCCSAGRHRL